MATLREHWHGKSRVRVLKRTIQGSTHNVLELTVAIQLWGDTSHVFLNGDNTDLVATDTMKNTVYCVAKTTNYDSLEQYGLALSQHFLSNYPVLSKVQVNIREHPWIRLETKSGPHQHGFTRDRNDYHIGCVVRDRSSVTVSSGIRDLVVLKTTQSGFVGFKRDKYTLLPEVTDRFLATNVSADWTYTVTPDSKTQFNAIYESVRSSLVDTFFGPPNTGVYSKSVQETMFKMGEAVLKSVANVANVALDMPNIHFLPVPQLASHGLKWENDIFNPTDEPHGTIGATVTRSKM